MQRSDVLGDRPEFVITRVLDAPRQRVYQFWTDPRYVQQWWGVEGCKIVHCELEVRAGGKFRIDMQTGEGTVYVNRGVYLDVVADERIVWRDERDGHGLTGGLPTGTHTVTFEDAQRGTLVTLRSSFDNIEDRDLMVRYGVMHGIEESLNRLAARLEVIPF